MEHETWLAVNTESRNCMRAPRAGREGRRPANRARDGAGAPRRCRSAQADLCRPWQKARSRNATDTVARRIARRRAIRSETAQIHTGIYVRRSDHTRARHWRQWRHLRARRRHLASPLALTRARPPRDRLGAKRRAATWPGIAAQHARLERPSLAPSRRWRDSFREWAAW